MGYQSAREGILIRSERYSVPRRARDQEGGIEEPWEMGIDFGDGWIGQRDLAGV